MYFPHEAEKVCMMNHPPSCHTVWSETIFSVQSLFDGSASSTPQAKTSRIISPPPVIPQPKSAYAVTRRTFLNHNSDYLTPLVNNLQWLPAVY